MVTTAYRAYWGIAYNTNRNAVQCWVFICHLQLCVNMRSWCVSVNRCGVLWTSHRRQWDQIHGKQPPQPPPLLHRNRNCCRNKQLQNKRNSWNPYPRHHRYNTRLHIQAWACFVLLCFSGFNLKIEVALVHSLVLVWCFEFYTVTSSSTTYSNLYVITRTRI